MNPILDNGQPSSLLSVATATTFVSAVLRTLRLHASRTSSKCGFEPLLDWVRHLRRTQRYRFSPRSLPVRYSDIFLPVTVPETVPPSSVAVASMMPCDGTSCPIKWSFHPRYLCSSDRIRLRWR